MPKCIFWNRFCEQSWTSENVLVKHCKIIFDKHFQRVKVFQRFTTFFRDSKKNSRIQNFFQRFKPSFQSCKNMFRDSKRVFSLGHFIFKLLITLGVYRVSNMENKLMPRENSAKIHFLKLLVSNVNLWKCVCETL